MEAFLENVLKGPCKAQVDYYEVLGCDELSTDEQLLCEYKVKALKFHPDKNPGNPEAAQEFQRIQEARDVLLDPQKRKKYDKWRKSGLSMPFQQYVNLNVTLYKGPSLELTMSLLAQYLGTENCHILLLTEESVVEVAVRPKSLHWVTKKTKEPMLMEHGYQVPMETRVDSSGGAPSSWRSKETADELLRKFRNYEI